MDVERFDLNNRYERIPDVIRREIADEILLVPIRGNIADMRKVFVLDDVSDFIWQQLETQRSCGEILDALLSMYEVDVDRATEDMAEFMTDLLEANLVVEVIE